MTNIRIVKDKDAPESIELLAKSVIQVGEASQKILDAGLTKRGLIVLLQDMIGPSNIRKRDIALVLDNLPRLKAWYVK